MKQCPACHNWTLDYDDYFGRYRCFSADCSWMAPSAVERQIRLLRSYNQPSIIDTRTIDEINMTIVTAYDEENDALILTFSSDHPSFELPEDDGRILWSISRLSGEVTGITIVGARKFGVSEIRIDFGTRKEIIERNMRSIPSAIQTGRPTRSLIESVSITMHSCTIPAQDVDQDVGMTCAFREALKKFNKEYASTR